MPLQAAEGRHRSTVRGAAVAIAFLMLAIPDGATLAAGGRDRIAELMLGQLPERGSAAYSRLQRIAGRPQIKQLDMTRAEVWRIPATRLSAFSAAATSLDVTVERIDRRRMGAVLRMLPKSHRMSQVQTGIMSETMASRSVMGMTTMRAMDPRKMEHMLMHGIGPTRHGDDGQPVRLTLDLSASERVTLVPLRIERKEGHAVWHGKVESTGQTVSLLWWPDGRLAGTIHHKGRAYAIRSLGGREHAVVEIAPEMLPQEHAAAPPAMIEKMGMMRDPLVHQGDASMLRGGTTAEPDIANRAADPSVGSSVGSLPVAITVAVAYTRKAAAHYTDIRRDLIEGAIVDANVSFLNSGIDNVRLELVHAYQTDYAESGSHFDHVWRFADKGDGFMEEIGGIRDRHAADVAILLVHDLDGCGLATRVGADAEEAFAVVHHECAQTSYSIAHEIGHIIGARHDIALDTSDSPLPFGHGLVTPRWRTMMAYKNACNGCPRIPYWSNPGIRFRGVPTGTAQANNAAVIRALAGRVAAFRPAVASAAADEASR